MANPRRAVRHARQLLATHQVAEFPVPVDIIAAQFAHVLEADLEDDISGMLVPLNPPIREKRWAIVVNRTHPPQRKRFTVAHELGHLVLHGYTQPHADRTPKIRFRSKAASGANAAEETEANRFAAELLMPAYLLEPVVATLELPYAPDESDTLLEIPEVKRLAKKAGVSTQALSFRLAALAL